jgi:integrase
VVVTRYTSMGLTLMSAWDQFVAERSISLSATSLTSDYRQATKWLSRCPYQNFETEGRLILTWVLQQQPVQSARRVAMYLKALYRWASQEDIALIGRNPIMTFRMPKAPQKDEEIVVIPRNEIGLVMIALEAKQTYRNVNWATYAEFMLQTAMRTGEVRALTWDDIKDDKILVHKNFTLTHGLKNSTKTNKKRWVPLNAKCKEILDTLDQNEEYLFPWDRSSFQSYFRKKMDRLRAADLITHLYRPYDLRHTTISRWIEAGIPVAQVASWAGNTADVIWRHYANTTQTYEIPVL